MANADEFKKASEEAALSLMKSINETADGLENAGALRDLAEAYAIVTATIYPQVQPPRTGGKAW